MKRRPFTAWFKRHIPEPEPRQPWEDMVAFADTLPSADDPEALFAAIDEMHARWGEL